jgi:hypothetical protein
VWLDGWHLDLTALSAADPRGDATASHTAPERLGALLQHDAMWVRREAARHPNTPHALIVLMQRAGANATLTGPASPAPTLAGQTLSRLSQGGPWARQLAAAHPNTPSQSLQSLAQDDRLNVRRALLKQSALTGDVWRALLTDSDAHLRAETAARADAPVELCGLLHRAGSSLDLREPAASIEPDRTTGEELHHLSQLGPWARWLAARHPRTPRETIEPLTRDPVGWVRLGVIDHPQAPPDFLESIAPLADPDTQTRLAAHPQATAELLDKLAAEANVHIRLAVAEHAHTSPETLHGLAQDGAQPVRQAAAAHANTSPDVLTLLQRAGSTADLTGFAQPDPDLSPAALALLAGGGLWARQLVARHPSSTSDLLASLIGDGDFRVREAVAQHPNRPQGWINRLVEAGSTEDLQGYQEPADAMDADQLQTLLPFGPWARRVVARHPSAGPLLSTLATDPAIPTRRGVARHPEATTTILWQLAEDSAPEVRWSILKNAAATTPVLATLAGDPLPQIRLGVACDARTDAATLSKLQWDLDAEVRATAAERAAPAAQPPRSEVPPSPKSTT